MLLNAQKSLVIIATLAAVAYGQGDSLRIDLPALQREAEKPRPATGPWHQVAAIKSHQINVVQGGIKGYPTPTPGNHNVVAFLGNDRFAVADGKHAIRIFDADSGAELRSFGQPEPDGFPGRQMIVSADGRCLMLLPDAEPAIWDTGTGKEIAKLPRLDDRYTTATFLPGKLAVATYRGEKVRGRMADNLQVWTLDVDTGKATLHTALTADGDARALQVIGPYLVVRGYRQTQILDAATFAHVLDQSATTDEEFLYVDPPAGDAPGVYAAIVYHREDVSHRWTTQSPELRIVSLADGKELKHWPCPIEEDLRGNDHRYQARYTMSPRHELLAISQEGRVNFFKFLTGEKVGTVPANFYADHPNVLFIDEQHALVTQQRQQTSIEVINFLTGETVASLPDDDYMPLLSHDGRRVIARRRMMPITLNQRALVELPEPLFILWKRTATGN